MLVPASKEVGLDVTEGLPGKFVEFLRSVILVPLIPSYLSNKILPTAVHVVPSFTITLTTDDVVVAPSLSVAITVRL